jgi:hypothetical protein
MVKTGFCQRQFRQTNEHQRYLNKKLNSELHGEVCCLLSVNMTYRVLLLQGG